MSGSMRGMWKRSYGRATKGTARRKGRQQTCPAYCHRATSRLYQSISAYGIGGDRLLPLGVDRRYLLKQGWAVTSIWSDHLMHPTAPEIMRCSLRLLPRTTGSRRIALWRQKNAGRWLENWDDIAPVLARAKYDIVDIAGLDFVDQARTFSEADSVFSTLGSGLTGLIYSPAGVAVTSVAPALFEDRFFYALVVDRRGRYADVRGPIQKADPMIPHRGSFTIEPERVADALAIFC